MRLTTVALILLAFICTACDDSDEEQHNFSQTVGLLFYEPANDWRQASVVYGIKQAESIGLTYELKLSATAAQQEKALEQMIHKGIRTFVLCDQGINKASAEKAIAQGAKFVTFDSEVSFDYTAYVSSSHEDMGKIPGEYLRQKGVRKVIAFDVTSAQGINNPRMIAFRKALGDNISIEVIQIDSYTPESGLAVLPQIIASDADALWTQDDQVLMGFYEQLKEKAPQIRTIVSGAAYQPYLRIMKAETTDIDLATVTFSPENISQCIDIAASLIRGQQPAEKRIITPSKLITRENIDQYIKEGVKF